MRLLLDANTFVSFLLSRAQARSAVGAILGAASRRTLVLLFSDALAAEVRETVASRSHLRERIATKEVEELILAVSRMAEPLDPISHAMPEIGRDRKDDYLIAHAVLGRADYLVSWDKDLLDLGTVAEVRIAKPGDIVQLLRAEGLSDE